MRCSPHVGVGAALCPVAGRCVESGPTSLHHRLRGRYKSRRGTSKTRSKCSSSLHRPPRLPAVILHDQRPVSGGVAQCPESRRWPGTDPLWRIGRRRQDAESAAAIERAEGMRAPIRVSGLVVRSERPAIGALGSPGLRTRGFRLSGPTRRRGQGSRPGRRGRRRARSPPPARRHGRRGRGSRWLPRGRCP